MTRYLSHRDAEHIFTAALTRPLSSDYPHQLVYVATHLIVLGTKIFILLYVKFLKSYHTECGSMLLHWSPGSGPFCVKILL